MSAPTNGIKPSRKAFRIGPLEARRVDELSGRVLRLRRAGTDGAEHYPVEYAVRVLLCKPQDCATTADLDIVGMTTQAQNLERSGGPSVQLQTDHALAGIVADSFDIMVEVCIQTFQGAFP